MDALLLLALLACPLGMGLMMWFMAKNMKGGGKSSPGGESYGAHGPRSVTQLRAQQSRLSAEIERFERGEDTHDDRLATR